MKVDRIGILIGTAIATMMAYRFATVRTVLAVEPSAKMPFDVGIHDLRFATGSGKLMRYSLSLPALMPRDGTQALALVLHYGGQATGYYGRSLLEQLLERALAALAVVMVAPVTMGGEWTDSGNEHAVLELLAMIERVYATDPARRLITGYSMGGAGTWNLIAQHAHHFSAAIPISGFQRIEPDRCKTPLYALHSNDDSIFDPDQLRQLIDGLASSGCEVQVAFVDGVDHFDVPAFALLLGETVPWLRRVWGLDP